MEEAAIIQAEEKLEKERRPKMKKGRGKNAKRRMKGHLKKTSSYPTGLDAEGYEVRAVCLIFFFSLFISYILFIYLHYFIIILKKLNHVHHALMGPDH